MTLQERCDAYNRAYAKWPASHLRVITEVQRPVVYGRWPTAETVRVVDGVDTPDDIEVDIIDGRWGIGACYSTPVCRCEASVPLLAMEPERGDGHCPACRLPFAAYFGAYPRGFLSRVMAMFPDVTGTDVLHAFAGSLPPGDYVRLDRMYEPFRPELVGSVYDVASLTAATFALILADPPYTNVDCARYKCDPVNRLTATNALAEVARPGALMVWLDQCWPLHAKRVWRTVGRIALTRSTNNRTRDVTIFERQ